MPQHRGPHSNFLPLVRRCSFGSAIDLCPSELRPVIDRINAVTYSKINNGVYRVGAGTSACTLNNVVAVSLWLAVAPSG